MIEAFILGMVLGIVAVSVYLSGKHSTKKRRAKFSALVSKIQKQQKPEPPNE